MSNTFVILMGMGVVFFGLTCIVFLVFITGKIVQGLEKKSQKPLTDQDSKKIFPNQPQKVTGPIQNRSELLAAISAVLAEELGTTVQGLRICHLKRINGSNYSRGELAAAISAAIAEDMGTSPAGIRIISMKNK